jgi:hypothetical protein
VLDNPANRRKAIGLTARQFHSTFTNTMAADQSRPFMTPSTSRRVLFQGAFAYFNPRAVMPVSKSSLPGAGWTARLPG